MLLLPETRVIDLHTLLPLIV